MILTTTTIDRKLIISLAVLVLCLLLSLLFPAGNTAQEITKDFFFLVIIPVLYIKFILKENLSAYGLNLKNKKTGLLWSAAMFLALIAASYLLINYTDFKDNYHLSPYVTHSFGYFLLYELILVNFFLFISDFFLRGIVLFTLAPKLGLVSIIFQASLYYILLLSTAANLWQLAPVLLLSVANGLATYKSRSFVYSYLSGLLYLILLDAYLISILK